MDDEFMSVRTWQGSIMVSTSLLPQSFDESYPNSSIRSNNPVESNTVPHPQYRNNAHVVTATPMRPAPPPVPDYWHHGTQAASGAASAASGANLFDFDANFYYSPSSPFDPSFSR